MTKKKSVEAEGEVEGEAPKKTVKKAAVKKATTKKAVKAEDAAEDGATPVKKVKKTTAKKPSAKSKKAAEAEVRVKLFWGVFSPTMKRVAVFHYHEKKLAEKKAKELTDGKSPHFVAKIKEAIEPTA
jgi:hypothetical protein